MATVLVVDDEPDLRELVRINLSLDGHRVLQAADGDEALQVVHDQAPDVIVLDVMMPRRDGWEVLGTIKAETPPQAQIPVLMLTAKCDELDQARGGIEGAIRYITKPFAVAELRAAVTQALQGEPEPVKRRQAQHLALTRLARLQRVGQSSRDTDEEPGRPPAARPHLTRLETRVEPPRSARQPRPPVAPADANLSSKQFQLLGVVGGTATVREAAERLGVSRSYVYASLRRIARKLGLHSGPELVGMAREGTFRADE
jgi:DNA-binding response OmpR family regulator/DNA-binding CsgD family transcriptional regulator